MSVDPMHDYRAYLLAREAAEDFLLAYARATNDDDVSFSRERGLEELRKLAAHLGFELVPVSNEKKDAAQMSRLVVHIDTNSDLNYLSDGAPVELLIIDERCPRDRVYRHGTHPTLNGVIDKLIGSSRIGELGDMPGTEAAIRAAMNGDEQATKLHLVKSEKQSTCAVIGCAKTPTAFNNESEQLCDDCLNDWNSERTR